jgi:predicted RNase H-like HicB family nuclease
MDRQGLLWTGLTASGLYAQKTVLPQRAATGAKMHYPATLIPRADGSGRYDVCFADLPGCISQGTSLEDALRMAEEALALHLGGMIEDGEPLPRASSLEEAREQMEDEARKEGYELPPGTLYRHIRPGRV